MEIIKKRLFEMQDLKYREFTIKLIPGINKESVIGVRIPLLRKLAHKMINDNTCKEFLNDLPHFYLEEFHLHSFIISEGIKEYEEALYETERFLPLINNWAVCDSFRPCALKRNIPDLLLNIEKWLKSEETYTVRFALNLLIDWFLDENFSEDMLYKVSEIKSDEYYVNMAISWYYSMALVSQYHYAVPLLENKVLEPWVHNKTIQKAIESRQISLETKDYLRSLRIKKPDVH